MRHLRLARLQAKLYDSRRSDVVCSRARRTLSRASVRKVVEGSESRVPCVSMRARVPSSVVHTVRPGTPTAPVSFARHSHSPRCVDLDSRVPVCTGCVSDARVVERARTGCICTRTHAGPVNGVPVNMGCSGERASVRACPPCHSAARVLSPLRA